jgi:hypothetical protein
MLISSGGRSARGQPSASPSAKRTRLTKSVNWRFLSAPFTFDLIEELHEQLAKPPLMLTTERLWSAYARVQATQVKGADKKRQLTDLVSLVRFALGLVDG